MTFPPVFPICFLLMARFGVGFSSLRDFEYSSVFFIRQKCSVPVSKKRPCDVSFYVSLAPKKGCRRASPIVLNGRRFCGAMETCSAPFGVAIPPMRTNFAIYFLFFIR